MSPLDGGGSGRQPSADGRRGGGSRALDRLRARGRAALACRFGIDSRALAALRVALGLLLLADLAVRSRDLVAFYSDSGVLPRSTLSAEFPAMASLSIHAASGATWFQSALFLLATLFAVSLLLGYRTRIATAGSLVLLVSLHARNPLLLNAGDSLLRRLLFWGLFLPLGGRWSIDALREARPRSLTRVAGIASAALLLQVVLVYTVNGVLKLRGDRWLRGEAIQSVFGLDHLTVLLGDVLAQYPDLLRLFDWLWLGMTVSSVLLVLLTGRSRTLLVSLFVAMHLGMALTMRLGLFPLISIAALLPFLPSPIWDTLEAHLSRGLSMMQSGVVGNVVDRDRWRRWLVRVRSPSPAVAAPPALGPWSRRAVPALVAVLLALVLLWNGAALGYVDAPQSVESAVDPTEYRWDMFAPDPRTTDGWYVVPGRLESGEQVDAFHGGPVEWDRPPELAATYPSHRWFVYLLDLRQEQHAGLRPDFAGYLCQRWNQDNDDELVELAVYYVEQPVRLDGPSRTQRVELARHSCEPGRER